MLYIRKNSSSFYHKKIVLVMKKASLITLLAVVLTASLSSCQLIGDIFKAGVWSGIILVALVLGLIIFIIAKVTGGGRK
jgi:hypothetical protein